MNPTYFTARDSMTTEWEAIAFLYGLVRGLQPDYCIETGSYKGFTAEKIGEALADNGHGRLVTLEVSNNLANEAMARTAHLPVRVELMSSLDFEPDEKIDFAFFDSVHAIRLQEFEHFLPWFHEETIVSWHDTRRHKPLKELIAGLEGEGRIRRFDLPSLRGVTVANVLL